jgi:large subunit ribosomal protein L17e
VHYKNTFETANAIRGMGLRRAIQYYKDVLGVTQGRWPQKSVKVVMSLLQNLEANAQVKII